MTKVEATIAAAPRSIWTGNPNRSMNNCWWTTFEGGSALAWVNSWPIRPYQPKATAAHRQSRPNWAKPA